MTKEWKLKEHFSCNPEEQLLLSRGIKTEKDTEKFFNPDYEKDLRDPFLMLGMDKAVSRILLAIEKKEKVVVYGDYDADGICSSVIFHDFFKKIGFENFTVYIPDRYTEGYGLSDGAVDEFIKNKVNLIITIDCGVTDVEEIKKLKEHGVDTIVLDHHEEGEKLPLAAAIVDVKQKKDTYPFKSFCGAGVAFKTVEAILKKESFNVTPGWHKWLLDVVAIATVADMVPLLDENRTLVFWGLQVLRKTPRAGLNALFETLKLDKANITEDDVAFVIGPRINATSRMDHATTGFQLLTTGSDEEGKWLTERVNEKNEERKNVVSKLLAEADEEMKNRDNAPGVLVFGKDEWAPGVLGMAANKIMEKYGKPVFVWGRGEKGNTIKGSARSNGAVNLVFLMAELGKDFFLDYGGHILSAGFTLRDGKEGVLRKKIEDAFEKVKGEMVEDALLLDKEMDLESVDFDLLETVEKFRPFGMNNEKPLFLLKNLEVAGAKSFGNGGIHLQLDFKKHNGRKVSAVGFFMRNQGNFDIKSGDMVDLAASLERNVFRGKNELRLRIIDVKIKK